MALILVCIAAILYGLYALIYAGTKNTSTQQCEARAISKRGIIISSAYVTRSHGGGTLPEATQDAVRTTVSEARARLKQSR